MLRFTPHAAQRLCPIAAALLLALSPLRAEEDERGYLALLALTMSPRTVVPTDAPPATFEPHRLSIALGVRMAPWWGWQLSSCGIWGNRDTNTVLAGTAWLRLGSAASVYGLAGVDYYSANFSANTGVTPCVGAGLHLNLARQWALKAEGTVSLEVFGERVTRLGAGVAYRFR
jgi:hypothetical protein